MKKSLIVLALVAGCGAADQDGNIASPPAQGSAQRLSEAAAPSAAAPAAAEPANLTGLYEGPASAQTNQLCIVEKAGKAQFGIVVWGANLRSCSGAGDAVRSGEALSLKMAGDSECTVQGTIKGGAVTLAAAVPEGCAYYCGAGARFAGAAFTRTGATAADAAKAKDLAGDPLCSR